MVGHTHLVAGDRVGDRNGRVADAGAEAGELRQRQVGADGLAQGRVLLAGQHLDRFETTQPGLQRKTGIGAADVGEQAGAAGMGQGGGVEAGGKGGHCS